MFGLTFLPYDLARLSGEPGIFLGTNAFGHNPKQCPLWVISGHFAVQSPCSHYPRKRTFVSASDMSTVKSLDIGGYLLNYALTSASAVSPAHANRND